MKGWAREVAQHHAREGPLRIASTSCLRSIVRNITRSSVKTQRCAQQEVDRRDFGAKLAPQNLQKLLWDIDVFTLVGLLPG